MTRKKSTKLQTKTRKPTRKKPVAIKVQPVSKRKFKRDQKAHQKSLYLASLPKSRFKRTLFRLSPAHQFRYWFSWHGLGVIFKVLMILIILTFAGAVSGYYLLKKDLPKINNIFGQNLGGSVTYYDRTGKIVLYQDYNSVKRIPVTANNISNYIKEATVAAEDKNFYHEGGFDIASIIRAGFHDLTNPGGGLQGASTITEQVVKLNKGWPDPLTIPEKIEEIALSFELAHEYSKSQVLTAYLNIAPYGNVDYGVQAAAEDYFNENASQLTLPQSVMLASIPRAPTIYSPFSDPKYNAALSANYFYPNLLQARMNYVYGQMVLLHMITQAQANQAEKFNVLSQVQALKPKYNNIIAPYFVLTAKQQLLNEYGSKLLQHGAWKVRTTLSIPLQNLAQQVVQNDIPTINRYGADEAALVAEQVKTGQVVALVGGTNFNNPQYGQVNYANTYISPGSTIKPYDYSTFINNKANNAGAGSVLYDTQGPLPGYPCTNKALPTQGGNCLWDYDFR